MTALAIVLVLLSIAVGACAIFTAVRRRRTPLELRGDWWVRFEREFRAYADARERTPA
jgi:hypothetical protein